MIHDIKIAGEKITEQSSEIEQWLAHYNVEHEVALDRQQIITFLSYTSQWAEEESKTIRKIDDEVTTAISVLKERDESLKQHEQKRLSKRSLEELNVLLETASASLENVIRLKNEIDFRFKQNEENKTKIGDLLKTIESKALIAENWGRLNDIIGSADGKKFRQIAQEYTLDVLLGFANIHLSMLSKRYCVLRIPDTLGLQVVDCDMGNEIRTVYSLSGGESFLVSLALALGLASLSTSRMQVESLFIDEGFGSLDPNTLNIAMDALERLHNQGRKVGVISHVQEMTERIPARIEVCKMSNGKSKIEISTN